ncbi:MAG: GIY-YIG nuclease family protein [Elusimicrobia bacterium]|nr:GIY-YIG nuclease family protein [Candidatus Liberimonas magnetica]
MEDLKKKIIDEIRRTAKENGGKPLGISGFEKETGIKVYEWKKYWPRFGDAQSEAGFMPNQLTIAYSDEFIIEKVVGVMRKLNKFPTFDELSIEKRRDAKFPGMTVYFRKYGSKQEFAKKILEYCTSRKGYDDIIKLCKPILEKPTLIDKIDNSDINQKLGEVYLFKSGRYYRIGRTNDTVRCGKEIKMQLAENPVLIHSIKTDDPSGIEAYWHKRLWQKE